jgi:hypothetical protein
MKKFLVVYEDLWGNKESYFTDKIGTTIKEIMKDFELALPEDMELDYEHYNSKDPYQAGVFGVGFYDIEFMDKDDIEQYAGKIMIFDLEGAVELDEKPITNKTKKR